MVMDEKEAREIANEALRTIVANPDFNNMKDLIGRELDVTDKMLDEAVKVLFDKQDIVLDVNVLDVKKCSTLRMMRITYEHICGISRDMADFLDTIASGSIPTMAYLSQCDNYLVQKLKDFAVMNPDDASVVETILEEMKKTGDIHLAWG